MDDHYAPIIQFLATGVTPEDMSTSQKKQLVVYYSSLHNATMTCMEDEEELEERIAQLIQLEEDRFIAGFHQKVAKDRQKAWHDRHIKKK